MSAAWVRLRAVLIAAAKAVSLPFRNGWTWLTDPVFPERVTDAVLVALLAGAAVTGAYAGLGIAIAYLWVLLALKSSLAVARQVKRALDAPIPKPGKANAVIKDDAA